MTRKVDPKSTKLVVNTGDNVHHIIEPVENPTMSGDAAVTYVPAPSPEEISRMMYALRVLMVVERRAALGPSDLHTCTSTSAAQQAAHAQSILAEAGPRVHWPKP